MGITSLPTAGLLAGALIQTIWGLPVNSQGLPIAQNQSTCTQLQANKTLSLILQRTNDATGFLKVRPGVCGVLAKYLSTPQEDLILTSVSTQSGQSVCISANTRTPCTDLVADIEDGVIAGEALQFVFADSMQTSGPQKQTVERLFIRPASIIR